MADVGDKDFIIGIKKLMVFNIRGYETIAPADNALEIRKLPAPPHTLL
jgi:hypothetical protein